ncbi:hypothetical protein BGX30_000553 [Mortierella sp. GBA39]|nr:hypothetical protein BGX30_000553 [Mortierella sp. GBA39]
MSGSGLDNNGGRTFGKNTITYSDVDETTSRELDLYFKLDHIFHKEADRVRQLYLMSRGLRPYCKDNKRMHVHHINRRDHKDGGNFVLLPTRLHNNNQLHNIIGDPRSPSTIDRKDFRRASVATIRILFDDIMKGRHRHPAVTEAVRQAFIATYEKEPGGIEVMALDTTSADTPLCRNLLMSKDGKWLSASFNWVRFWLPLSEVTKEEVFCLMISSLFLSAKRLCIDIGACGPFYTINFDGGMDLNMAIVETMKRADFLLGAFAFGRDACSGILFEPKEGQLPGYKNPIHETARHLRDDPEYAAARCHYSSVWLQPTLVCDRPFNLPSVKWWDWWPELVFPKPVFRLIWRLVLVDLFAKQAYYDVPEALDEASSEAKVLLRPYQALMETFQQHGAAWVASEPDLNKVDWYAKVFQMFSLARASRGNSNIASSLPQDTQDILPAMTSSKTVYERADFTTPLPDSNEVDGVAEALETTFTVAIEKTSDRLVRAAQYQQLGQSCYRQKKYDSATVHFLEAARTFEQCTQEHIVDPKLECTPAEQNARDGRRECFAFTLESILMTSSDWVLQKDKDKTPAWWKPLHGIFGNALVNVDQVLADPHFAVTEGSQARTAASLFVRVLLIDLAQEMLAKFERIQDLDGILRVCVFMGGLYERMKEDDGIRDGVGYAHVVAADDGVGASRTRWSSIEQVTRSVNNRLFAKTDKEDPFNVLEVIMRSENSGYETSLPVNQRNSRSSGMDHPLAGFPYGGSASKSAHDPLISDSKLAQAELAMDTYFIDGNITASLACALVLVEDEEIAGLSTFDDRVRLWIKASVIAEYAVAQRDLLSARTLVNGVGKALDEKSYKVGSMIENKAAMLSYLTEACTLLTAHGRLFPRASMILLGSAHNAMAKVHRAWFDDDAASKWTVAAQACLETAKSKDDVLGSTNYAYQWLLDESSRKKPDALKCTKGWHAMVATLV